jgi:predicted enzyme related to lactoylglutathione lyase
MADECIVVKSNLGLSKCDDLPQMPRGMITTPASFSLTAAQAADPALALAAIQDAIKNGLASRVYLWPKFVGMEDASEEAIYEDTPLADIAVRDGKYRWRFHIKKSMCLHKAMFTHRGSGDRVFLLDNKNQLFGTELSNGNIAGFTMSLLHTEKLKFSDGSVATKSPIYVVLEDSEEVDESGVLFDGTFVRELIPLTDVSLAVTVVDSDNVRVAVTRKCDGIPVSGLVAADFVFTTSGGAAQAPDTVTETSSGSGIYLAVRAANFVDGFVNLEAAADLTIDAYESTGAVAIDIP